jgi:hypothetical protein
MGSSARVAILGTVPLGREHYCPILARQLDVMWPSHPPLYYALPAGRTSSYERAVQTAARTWVETLLAGLEHLRQLGNTHVFMLLEDHVPLWSCDERLLDELLGLAIGEDLPCLFFLKWEWPWRQAAYRTDADGRIRGWRQIDIVTVDGHALARVPRDSLFYNQCQPALWKLDYYTALVAAALRCGITDPWAFEKFVLADQPAHYVAPYRWPSRSSGYRRRGQVYWRALYAMKMPEGRELRDALLAERFPSLDRSVRGALGACFGLWGHLRGWSEGRSLADRVQLRRREAG